ncbi:sulfotransferase domain-containing protein [Planctomycetes bacterium K23_9]|uniref:Sulfotransferase domain protein n=1 Tax=Stieleria marina TaxID=1930275 RepID=A0A517NSL3_9BACT|nr:Sulfotransferase domain protein [Planctomycetes bacterium K23_9]
MSSPKSLSRATIYYRAVQRLFLWHCCTKRLPLYPVTEFPKCGGTWYCQMLSKVLDQPFSRNSSKPIFGQSIIHGHHLFSPHFHRPVSVIRDGRDAIVSAYYHFLFRNEVNSNYGVNRTRKALPFDDYDNIQSNLPAFIDYMFTVFNQGGKRFSWTEYIMDWHDKDRLEVRYEDLLVQPAEELLRSARWFGFDDVDLEHCQNVADQFTFKKMSGRARGQTDSSSFMRKGIAGDWINSFSPLARERFHVHAGDALQIAGYETDDSWVTATTGAAKEVVDA